MRLIFKILPVLFCVACSTSDTKDDYKAGGSGPKSKVFYERYDRVWKASQIALAHYPLKAYDVESGTIETEYITGEAVWLPPHLQDFIPGGYRYKINIKVLRGKKDGDTAVQIVVLKQVERKSDFFSNYEKFSSDGLEEIAILYRIDRELNFIN